MNKLILLSSIFLFTACAGPRYTIQPVVQPGQTTEANPVCLKCGKTHSNSHSPGALVIQSKQQHTVTVRQLQAEVRQHERPEFNVQVKNEGTAAMEFSLAKIEVQRNGTPSKTYTVEELMAERDAAAAAEAAAAQGVAMGMAMSAQINANMAQMSINNASRPGASVNYQMQQLNSALSYANQGMMQDSMARSYALNAALASPQYHGLQFVLRPGTISAGQTGGGIVVTGYLAPPGPHTLKLKVDAAGENHEFEFVVVGTKQK